MLVTLLLILSSCISRADNAPESIRVTETDQIRYGSELCAFTNQVIETVRYGGRIEMEDGTVLSFMSAECLAGFYLQMPDPGSVRSLKVVDFTHGKRLLDVSELVFLNSPLRPSPNGMYLTAIEAEDKKMVTNIYEAYPGPLLNWEEVLEKVAGEWNLAGNFTGPARGGRR